MMKIIKFFEIAATILGVRGNKWNNKRSIDMDYLIEAMEWENIGIMYGVDTEAILRSLAKKGEKGICIVMMQEDGRREIVWDRQNNLPLLFNARQSGYGSAYDITDRKLITEDEVKLTRSHLDYCDSAANGTYYTFENVPLCDSMCNEIVASVATPYSFSSMREKVGELTFEKMRALPDEKYTAIPEHKFVVYPEIEEPCFLTIDGKILRGARKRPLIYNATVFRIDSYTESQSRDFTIYEDWTKEDGIGIKTAKGEIEDWK